MSLEKIRYDVGKIAVVSTLLLMLALGACGRGSRRNPVTPPAVNQAPTTTIEYFLDGENVNYTAEATDPDGFVRYITVEVNGGPQSQELNLTQAKPFVFNFSVPIEIGVNRVRISSTDNEGLENLVDATSSFNVAPPINNAPETTISAVVRDSYLDVAVCGTDQDGYVERINYQVNGGTMLQEDNPTQTKPFCFSFSEQITPGEDITITAEAIDNDGLSDPTEATYIYSSEPSTNQEPETTITDIDFGNGYDGLVRRGACASYPGGLVDHINFRTNDVPSTLYNVGDDEPFCPTFSEAIVPGSNPFEAVAVARDGNADSSPATSTFYSPETEADARAIVDRVLTERGLVEDVDYWKDTILTINEFNPRVDYNFLCSSGVGTKGILDAISFGEVYADEIFKRQLFGVINMPHLSAAYLPEEEAIPRIENFLDITLPGSLYCP